MESLGATLLFMLVALLSYGVASFFKGKKIRKLSDELSKEKRKNFDRELDAIKREHDTIPIDELLEEDEHIINDKKN